MQMLEQYDNEGLGAVAIDAPLLFESGFDRLCDKKICVYAPEEIAIKRITERDGISREKALARLEKQIDYKTLCSRCDYVIENDDIQSVTAQVDDIIKREGL
jgi:dephospho-CoA kinase